MRALNVSVFACVSLFPLLLVAGGAGFGGAWVWAALGACALLSPLIDLLSPAPAADSAAAEFPGSDLLLACLALGALGLLPLVVAGAETLWQAGQRGHALGLVAAAGLWLGQVAHPAGHELIHRADRRLFALGVAVYGIYGFGHHVSAHRLVHHRHVASPHDPNSAPAGEGFYRFAPRAWVGSLRAGLAAERHLRGGIGPYRTYGLAAMAGLGVASLVGGFGGAAIWLALSLHFALQVLLSDYVQHYGLRRRLVEGKAEPVGPAHSWNAPQWFSSALMINATRHSDHHAHPARPYPALRLAEGAPVLPWPLPVACAVALCPPVWRRRMGRALAALTKA